VILAAILIRMAHRQLLWSAAFGIVAVLTLVGMLLLCCCRLPAATLWSSSATTTQMLMSAGEQAGGTAATFAAWLGLGWGQGCQQADVIGASWLG
jgi:hypothetical protein